MHKFFEKSSASILPFVAVGFVILTGVVTMIGLYGKEVSREAHIKKIQGESEQVKQEIVVLQEKLVDIVKSENLKQLAAERSLVEDKSPEYFKGGLWVSALR